MLAGPFYGIGCVNIILLGPEVELRLPSFLGLHQKVGCFSEMWSRQTHGKNRAAALFAADRDFAPVLGDNPLGNA